MSGQFWYLATGYTKHPDGLSEAATMACRVTAELMRAGISVFSPIAYGHSVSFRGGLDPLDHNIWLPANEPFMRAAYGLIVYRSPGWEESAGIKHELAFFSLIRRPLCWLDPGKTPAAVIAYLRNVP